MKRYLAILPFLFILLNAKSQKGLERVIVEKYYISDSNDASANATDGVLPVGSTTYRIFLDLAPGYIFQSAYGDPNHELRIETSTNFFNNESRGTTIPNFRYNNLKSNTLMLDSWLTAGGACMGYVGVLKADDDGVGTVVNSNGLLQNADAKAGIPISQQDGMVAGNPPAVITVGISSEIAIFDSENTTQMGTVFSTNNGAWATSSGAMGADTSKNIVLIAQLTTNGILSFELNVQIRSSDLVVEQYVARNPVANEFTLPSLIYNSDSLISSSKSFVNDLIKVFPNPANEYINISFPESDDQADYYTIYNISGQVVHQEKLKSGINAANLWRVDVTNFIPGLYFLEVSLNGIRHHKRILVK
jgi:hypothetical protein